MKLQKKARFICCLLAVIVLVTGVCAAVKPADSYFVCDSEASVESCTLAKPQYFSCAEELCEPVIMQKGQTTELNEGQRRLLNRRLSNILIMSIVATTILPHQVHLENATDYDHCNAVASHVATVRYLQQQDGKK